ncbi:MAG: hypothetical protein AAB708_02840, partial [Patescibacteria group bacterium]
NSNVKKDKSQRLSSSIAVFLQKEKALSGEGQASEGAGFPALFFFLKAPTQRGDADATQSEASPASESAWPCRGANSGSSRSPRSPKRSTARLRTTAPAGKPQAQTPPVAKKGTAREPR